MTWLGAEPNQQSSDDAPFPSDLIENTSFLSEVSYKFLRKGDTYTCWQNPPFVGQCWPVTRNVKQQSNHSHPLYLTDCTTVQTMNRYIVCSPPHSHSLTLSLPLLLIYPPFLVSLSLSFSLHQSLFSSLLPSPFSIHQNLRVRHCSREQNFIYFEQQTRQQAEHWNWKSSSR